MSAPPAVSRIARLAGRGECLGDLGRRAVLADELLDEVADLTLPAPRP